MRPFQYVRADDALAAVAMESADPEAQYLAGGTTQLDLMLKDGVLEPERLVDITRLPLRGIIRSEGTLCVGALVTMEELAADATVGRAIAVRPRRAAGGCLAAAAEHGDDRRERPAADALPVFPRLRGRGLQQARARSGCAAVTGAARMHAILGASERCIALRASDPCVALEVSANGERLELGGPKQRALLAMLLLNADQVVSSDRLVEALWADKPPAAARHTLEVNVPVPRGRPGVRSNLRSVS